MIVRHSRGEYPIEFRSAQAIWASLNPLDPIVTDRNVARHYADALRSFERVFVLPAGERTKNLTQFGRVLGWLAGVGAKRSTRVVALGGGVIGDLVGFAAASYMRGVPFLQIPTTLLAMVDSSVGGKVGIDLPAGKNLAGAFHAPSEVWIAPDFLNTLPARQHRNGAAEVWKAGYIHRPALLDALRKNPVRPNHPDLRWIIEESVEMKRQVVEADEFETNGLRATLNFGHTVGHAIERQLNYRRLLHGEAIAVGMVWEAKIGERLGVTPAGTARQIAADMAQQGLPTEIPLDLDRRELVTTMAGDKKATDAGLALSLLTGWGTCKLITGIDPTEVVSILISE